MQKKVEQKLDCAEKELMLIHGIDHIRDSSPEPSAMFSGIVNVISECFSTDLCLFCLRNKESGAIELKAFKERENILQAIGSDAVKSLIECTKKEKQALTWEGKDILPELGISALPPFPLHIAAISVSMGENRLGGILIARKEIPFSHDETGLLKAAESQVDSAVIQADKFYELRQRNRELETIRNIDRIRDEHLPFEEMLNKVLQQLHDVISTEMSYIMLYEDPGSRLELRASTHEDLFRTADFLSSVEQISRDALDRGNIIVRNNEAGDLRSIMCIPLILEEEIIGVLGMVNSHRPDGFTSEDKSLLDAVASQMDTAIFESIEKTRLRKVLGRAVDPRVMERILSKPDAAFLKGERAEISVLYADIRGSTELAERSEPEPLVGFINDYLSAMTDIIFMHEGTLDKFVGDEVMALFGAPFPQEDHALRAVHAGMEMQKAHQDVLKAWEKENFHGSPIGIGIATGDLIAGEMGCSKRTDYTVIGRAANLGARICGVAGAGKVLISESTFKLVRDAVEAVPVTGLDLKGIGEDITVYEIKQVAEIDT